jgi:hypothetical protein
LSIALAALLDEAKNLLENDEVRKSFLGERVSLQNEKAKNRQQMA